ncbi:hypothetical protein Hanom_Chr12g01103261 [Helianthus anomalus]
MGAMKLILFLLVLLNFISSLSFAHVANNYSGREDDGVVNQRKFAHASARGGSGDGGAGRSTRENNNGYGGDSSPSQQGGGGAVIPVYAASGAATKRNNRHNTANTCSICWEHRLLIVMSSVLTSFLLHMRI